jgi:hypothetical protein
MTITITAEDVRLAKAAYKLDPAHISQTCPVFQALKRKGVPVRGVGCGGVTGTLPSSELTLVLDLILHLNGATYPLPHLPEKAIAVTMLHFCDWDKAVGVTFEYNYAKITTP